MIVDFKVKTNQTSNTQHKQCPVEYKKLCSITHQYG